MSLMQHLPIAVVLLPSMTAICLLLLGDRVLSPGQAESGIQTRRYISQISVTLSLLLSCVLVYSTHAGDIWVYRLGDWQAPFGIVLMIDRLSAMMLLLTAAVAWPVLWYARGGWDIHGRYFHSLFHFQLMGLNGAFVTGDLFNLFVFFEILLIASYVLLLHGQGAQRFKAGVHYVVLNLAASGLFLIGLGLIYSSLGTLNMVDIALRLSTVAADEQQLAKAAAWLLWVVFGLKAALVPLYFWLPSTYSAASAPVAALFAIMTKVGVYSIIRVHWMMFGEDAQALSFVLGDGLLWVALCTTLLSVFGVLAARNLSRVVAYMTVVSVGVVLVAVGMNTPQAMAAGLYYMTHSTLIVAAMFILVELIAAQRGVVADRLQPSHALSEPLLLGVAMLFAAASAAGLPPLPGFLGKLMILSASSASDYQVTIYAVLLTVGFLTVVALARAGSIIFWHVEPRSETAIPSAGRSLHLMFPVLVLFAASMVMTVFAQTFLQFTTETAGQLQDLSAYANAVLGQGYEGATRLYNGLSPIQH